MQKSENLGMQTFDSALFELWKAARISADDALTNADSANNLRLRIKLEKGEVSDEESETLVAPAQPAQSASRKISMNELSLEEIEEDEPDDDGARPTSHGM